MLIEQSAYANRWRRVSPAAKALFALAGLMAALTAASPPAAVFIVAAFTAVTLFGARVPLACYLRVALPALPFLGFGALPLFFSIGEAGVAGELAVHLAPAAAPAFATLLGRSLGALAALLFLILTTPIADLIALLRRLKAPELLLDLMILCYRMVFVFSAALQDTLIAQRARLGYGSRCLALRSLAALAASLAVQVWTRAAALQQAAEARNNDGPLRFLETKFERAGPQIGWALAASLVLLIVVAGLA